MTYTYLVQGPGVSQWKAPSDTLINNGGVVELNPNGYEFANFPTSSAGLPAGSFWNNNNEVNITACVYNTAADPVYFTEVSASELISLTGTVCPTAHPAVGSFQFWNNGGVLCVA